MAPRKRVVVVVALVLLFTLLVRGGQAQQEQAAPAPMLISGADDTEMGSMLARGVTHVDVVVGYGYIGCLEMRFSRCFGDPTLTCLEDAMVECSLEAAAAPASTMTVPAAPLVGGGAAAAELILGGIIGRGITTVGANYINCVEVELVKCLLDPTIACVEKAMGAC